MVSRFRMVLVFGGLVVVGAGGVRRTGPEGPAPDGLGDVGEAEGGDGEGGGGEGDGGGLDGDGGGAAVGEDGVHRLVLLWAAEGVFDLLPDGAGGLGPPGAGAGAAAEMVVGGGHACQASEGGDEDVEAFGCGGE